MKFYKKKKKKAFLNFFFFLEYLPDVYCYIIMHLNVKMYEYKSSMILLVWLSKYALFLC